MDRLEGLFLNLASRLRKMVGNEVSYSSIGLRTRCMRTDLADLLEVTIRSLAVDGWKRRGKHGVVGLHN
jgi:hypothetical protein